MPSPVVYTRVYSRHGLHVQGRATDSSQEPQGYLYVKLKGGIPQVVFTELRVFTSRLPKSWWTEATDRGIQYFI